MPFNLIETIKNYFNGEFTNKASAVLGENQPGISKALTAIIPVELAGILSKATSGPEGAADIYQKAKMATSISSAIPLIKKEDSPQSSNETSDLFGANQPGIINAISGFAGIKNSSTESLMSIGLPAILGILGKHAEEEDLSDSGLSGFLASQKDQIVQAIPPQLSSVTNFLGLGSPRGSVITDTKAHLAYASDDKPINRNNWVVPLIFIVIILGLLFYLSRGCNQTKPNAASDDDNVMTVTPQHHSSFVLTAIYFTKKTSFII
jgi:hypothetical protein